MLLDGRTVVVVGVGPGLGREVAVAALREGANVVLAARREKTLEATAGELDPAGARTAYRCADVTRPEQLAGLFSHAVQRFGAVDAVVLVAALDTVLGGVEATSLQDWRDTFEVNVFGAVHVTRAALPALRSSRGALVFVGSQSMLRPPPEALQVAYAASKGALLSMAYHLAQELGEHGIRVNTVVPSWMWGPPVQGFVAVAAARYGVSEGEVADGLAAKSPLRTIVPDEDVADAVVFLASPRARSVSGQSLLVNAGEHMR